MCKMSLEHLVVPQSDEELKKQNKRDVKGTLQSTKKTSQ